LRGPVRASPPALASRLRFFPGSGSAGGVQPPLSCACRTGPGSTGSSCRHGVGAPRRFIPPTGHPAPAGCLPFAPACLVLSLVNRRS
jgi:hypothetical protein